MPLEAAITSSGGCFIASTHAHGSPCHTAPTLSAAFDGVAHPQRRLCMSRHTCTRTLMDPRGPWLTGLRSLALPCLSLPFLAPGSSPTHACGSWGHSEPAPTPGPLLAWSVPACTPGRRRRRVLALLFCAALGLTPRVMARKFRVPVRCARRPSDDMACGPEGLGCGVSTPYVLCTRAPVAQCLACGQPKRI